MRLEQLKYFETLVQEGSYTRAATLLHISQPSLTGSIKAMEKELNKTLLIRDTRSIALTEDGKEVLAFARNTLAAYQALLEKLNPQNTNVSGNVTITASKFFCELILEPLLQTLHTLHPQIKIRTMQNDYLLSPDQFADVNCKLGIFTRITVEQEERNAKVLISDEKFYNAQYHYFPLFTDTFGFCVAKTSPLSVITPIYLDTIIDSHYPITLFPVSVTTISDEVLLTSNNIQLHIDAMLKENAYSNIPYFVYQKLFGHEEALTYRSYSNNMSITYYLIYPTDYTLSPAEQIFIEELQHYLVQMKFK